MFENYKVFETTYAGRKLVVETGKTCELSNGSCWVRYGETVVMANVTASPKPRHRAHIFFDKAVFTVSVVGWFSTTPGMSSSSGMLLSSLQAVVRLIVSARAVHNDHFLIVFVFFILICLNLLQIYCKYKQMGFMCDSLLSIFNNISEG